MFGVLRLEFGSNGALNYFGANICGKVAEMNGNAT